MTEIGINQPKNQTLAEEITKFMEEIKEIIDVSSQLNIQGRIRFDPFLFMAWRNANNK